jgi:hypothetical protein
VAAVGSVIAGDSDAYALFAGLAGLLGCVILVRNWQIGATVTDNCLHYANFWKRGTIRWSDVLAIELVGVATGRGQWPSMRFRLRSNKPVTLAAPVFCKRQTRFRQLKVIAPYIAGRGVCVRVLNSQWGPPEELEQILPDVALVNMCR